MTPRGPEYEAIKEALRQVDGRRLLVSDLAHITGFPSKNCSGAVYVMVKSGELVAHPDPKHARRTRYSLPAQEKKREPIRTGYKLPEPEDVVHEPGRNPVLPDPPAYYFECFVTRTGALLLSLSSGVVVLVPEHTARIAALLAKKVE